MEVVMATYPPDIERVNEPITKISLESTTSKNKANISTLNVVMKTFAPSIEAQNFTHKTEASKLRYIFEKEDETDNDPNFHIIKTKKYNKVINSEDAKYLSRVWDVLKPKQESTITRPYSDDGINSNVIFTKELKKFEDDQSQRLSEEGSFTENITTTPLFMSFDDERVQESPKNFANESYHEDFEMKTKNHNTETTTTSLRTIPPSDLKLNNKEDHSKLKLPIENQASEENFNSQMRNVGDISRDVVSNSSIHVIETNHENMFKNVENIDITTTQNGEINVIGTNISRDNVNIDKLLKRTTSTDVTERVVTTGTFTDDIIPKPSRTEKELSSFLNTSNSENNLLIDINDFIENLSTTKKITLEDLKTFSPPSPPRMGKELSSFIELSNSETTQLTTKHDFTKSEHTTQKISLKGLNSASLPEPTQMGKALNSLSSGESSPTKQVFQEIDIATQASLGDKESTKLTGMGKFFSTTIQGFTEVESITQKQTFLSTDIAEFESTTDISDVGKLTISPSEPPRMGKELILIPPRNSSKMTTKRNLASTVEDFVNDNMFSSALFDENQTETPFDFLLHKPLIVGPVKPSTKFILFPNKTNGVLEEKSGNFEIDLNDGSKINSHESSTQDGKNLSHIGKKELSLSALSGQNITKHNPLSPAMMAKDLNIIDSTPMPAHPNPRPTLPPIFHCNM